MSQGALFLPTTGVFSGLIEQNDINGAFDALVTMNSGHSAPTNAGSGGAPELGQQWLDTTTALFPIWKIYSGSAWIVVGTFDIAGGTFSPALSSGVGALTSAATVDLGSTKAAAIALAGATGPITSLGSSAPLGSIKTVVCASTPTFTNSSAIICIGGVDFVAQAGDVVIFAQMTAGNWTMVGAARASGVPLTPVFAYMAEAIKTITYSVVVADAGSMLVGNAAGTIAFNLPTAASAAKKVFHFKSIGAGTLNLTPNGAETIDGLAPFPLGQNQGVSIESNGSTWRAFGFYEADAGAAAAAAGTSLIGRMPPLRVAQAIAALTTSSGANVQKFVASGTWTKPAAGSMTFLFGWGAGGGGATSAGGGGGAYGYRWIPTSSLGATETVTVPAGGATSTGGGNATFGSWLTAYGGGAANTGLGGGGAGTSGAGGNSPGSGGLAGAGGAPIGGVGGNTGVTGGSSNFGGGGGASPSTSGAGVSVYGGGGGGQAAAGGSSVYGGGGGGPTGGASTYGGAGGGSGVTGSAPGGGGGPSAIGGRGEMWAITFP